MKMQSRFSEHDDLHFANIYTPTNLPADFYIQIITYF